MGDECLVHILERLSSDPVESSLFQVNLFYSGQFLVFSRFSWDYLVQFGIYQPLWCTIYSGLLIWMRVVLQGVSGGALQVMR